jgi:putative redox protein
VRHLSEKHVTVIRDTGFRHVVRARDHELVVDEPAHLGGTDTAASPLELLAAALGTCVAATVEMYAERKGWPLRTLKAEVVLTPPPSGGRARFHVTLFLPRTFSAAQVERLQAVARACPVRRTLEGADVTEALEVCTGGASPSRSKP